MEGSAQLARTALGLLLAMEDRTQSELERIGVALDDLRRRYVESPAVPPAVNWRAYTHADLYAMLYTSAEATQVGEQSMLVDELAQAASDTSEAVSRNSIDLPSIWRGQAAQNALSTLEQHARGGNDLGRFVASLARALDLASEALRRAQREMPKPVDTNDAVAVGAAGGTAAFGPIGGFVGSEIAKCAANQAAQDAKEKAVAVMEAYERELHDAYRQVTPPATLPPGPGHRNRPINALRFLDDLPDVQPPPPGIVPGTGGSGGGGSGSGTHGSGPTGLGTTGQPPTLPAASGVHTGHAGMPVTGVGPHGTAYGTAAGTSAAAAFGAGAGGAGAGMGMGMGMSDGLGGGSAWRDLTGRGAVPGLWAGGRPGQEGAGPRAGRPGAAGLGRRGGLPGMGAPGGGAASEEEDAEHHNKMPHSDQLFTFKDQPVLAPPVIGDWSHED